MLYVFLFFLFDINETVTEWTMASGVKRKFSSSATPSQEEESGRELLQLLPFKRKKKTDWSKCLQPKSCVEWMMVIELALTKRLDLKG